MSTPLLETCPRNWMVLPGWRQSAAHWRPVSRWLSRDRVSIDSEDLAEMSASSEAERGSLARLHEMAERLRQSASRAQTTVIIGHSAGAPLALLTAAASSSIRGVMLIEPVIDQLLPSHQNTHRHRFGQLVSLDKQGRAREYPLASLDTIRTIEVQSTTSIVYQVDDAPLPQSNQERTAAVAEVLSTLDIPILIVRGQRSGIVSRADIETLSETNSNVHTSEIALAGHSPHIDQPRRTANAMLQFEAKNGLGQS